MQASFSATIPFRQIESSLMRGIINLTKHQECLDKKLLMKITRISKVICVFLLAVSAIGIILGSLYLATSTITMHCHLFFYLILPSSCTLTAVALKIFWDDHQLQKIYAAKEKNEKNRLRQIIDQEYLSESAKLTMQFDQMLVESCTILSSNHQERHKSSPDKAKIAAAITNQRDEANQLINLQEDQNVIINHYIYACFAQKNQLGNCGELSTYCFFRFFDFFGFQINIEKFNVLNGDHAFLVLNRDYESDPRNYKTWKYAWVFDPWASTYFQASEIEDKLKCKFKTFFIEIKRKYNRRLDTLSLTFSNIYSIREFEKQTTQKELASPVKEQLIKLHQAKEGQKLAISKKISNICSELLSSDKLDEKTRDVISVLSSQCRYYIKLKTENHTFASLGFKGFFGLKKTPC